MNADLRKLATNLVPFPRLKFFIPGYFNSDQYLDIPGSINSDHYLDIYDIIYDDVEFGVFTPLFTVQSGVH